MAKIRKNGQEHLALEAEHSTLWHEGFYEWRWGKHRGKHRRDVPLDWLEYMAGVVEIDSWQYGQITMEVTRRCRLADLRAVLDTI